MTEMLTLEAQLRDTLGTGSAREARRNKQILGVIYGGKESPQHICLDSRPIEKQLEKFGFYTQLMDVKINGKSQRVIPKIVQLHPVTDDPLHIDFMRISKDSRVTVKIPVRFINDLKSPGIKKGGVLNAVVHEIEMRCSPENIPQEIIIDLEGRENNTIIHLDDLQIPEKAEVLHMPPKQTIATIVAPKVSGKAEDNKEGEASA